MQTALVHVLEPIFDHTFHERSFGFRHGRGCHDALRCVEALLKDGYVYLNPLDHMMASKGFQMIRYADDFVVLCRTQLEAEEALSEIRTWVEASGLSLHPEKTHIVDSREKSFAFLGYSFRDRFRFPRAKSHEKVTARIRELTPRKSGESLECIIARLNRSLRGWFNYFRHCFWNVFYGFDSQLFPHASPHQFSSQFENNGFVVGAEIVRTAEQLSDILGQLFYSAFPLAVLHHKSCGSPTIGKSIGSISFQSRLAVSSTGSSS